MSTVDLKFTISTKYLAGRKVRMSLKKTNFFHNIKFQVEEMKSLLSSLFLVRMTGNYYGALEALKYLKKELKTIDGANVLEAKILELESKKEDYANSNLN